MSRHHLEDVPHQRRRITPYVRGFGGRHRKPETLLDSLPETLLDIIAPAVTYYLWFPGNG